MERGVYRYTFEPSVPMREVRDSLFLAALAAEGIHGRTRVMMDASFRLDEEGRSCVIDGTREVDQSIAVIFTGFLRKEFGESAFTVKRVDEAKGGRT